MFKRQKSGRTEKIRFDREANWTNSSTVTVRATVTKKKRERERIEKITIENEVSRGPVSRNF